ncbi:MAG: hypothetical protein DRJ63_09040 [Thermoprotei archaeon]|nr:MAG: hypothetical protein DRJ63_09040 [Thermoprotei archaeon]
MSLNAMLRVAREVAASLIDEKTIGIILFGSLAKGTVDTMSDIDLALVLEGETKVKKP